MVTTSGADADVLVQSAMQSSGRLMERFCRPADLLDLEFRGDAAGLRVVGGSAITVGAPGRCALADFKRAGGPVSAMERLVFEGLMLDAMRNVNVNHFIELNDRDGQLSFTIGFDRAVVDDSAADDDVGELLLFDHGGDGWVKIQAVDALGLALGPWVVVDPAAMVATEPATTVRPEDGPVGVTAIDVSRLGVTHLEYLRVSNDVAGDPAYRGGDSRSLQLKILALSTSHGMMAAR